jgi:hypothetical protein
MQIRRWKKDVRTGGLGISPGLDTIAILLICWAWAPIDIFLNWVEVYKEAEEAKRKIDKENNAF